MAATAGSIYQSLLQSHLSGSPPDCDQQRSSETFAQYYLRMQCHACNPDIGATESDTAYLARLATYQPVLTETQVAYGNFTVSASVPVGTFYNCQVTRSGTGQYPVNFATQTQSPQTLVWSSSPIVLGGSGSYFVSFNGVGGNSSTTASVITLLNANQSGFTMSISNINTPLVAADPTTCSFKIN